MKSLTRKKKEEEDKQNTIISMINELQKVKTELEAEKKRNAIEEEKLKKSFQKFKEENGKALIEFQKQMKNNAYSKLYSLIRQYKFTEAISVLSENKEKIGLSEEEFTELSTRITRLDKIYQNLNSSGNKFTNTVTPEGIVIKIYDGTIDMNTMGTFLSKKWNSLSIDTLYTITSKDFTDIPENQLKSDIAILLGRPGDAIKLLPKDNTLIEILQATFTTNADSLKYTVAIDRKKALSKFQLIEKEFEGITLLAEDIQILKKTLETEPKDISTDK